MLIFCASSSHHYNQLSKIDSSNGLKGFNTVKTLYAAPLKLHMHNHSVSTNIPDSSSCRNNMCFLALKRHIMPGTDLKLDELFFLAILRLWHIVNVQQVLYRLLERFFISHVENNVNFVKARQRTSEPYRPN